MKPSEADMEWAQTFVDKWTRTFIDRKAATSELAAALAGEREKVFEQIEQRLIQEHTAGETGDDCAADFDEGWLSGAWNAINTVRELRALNGDKP